MEFFFKGREAIFPLSCLKKEYALLAPATHRALFGYAVKPKTVSAFKAASSSHFTEWLPLSGLQRSTQDTHKCTKTGKNAQTFL